MKRGVDRTTVVSNTPSTNTIALCASCDRCRARKTKCDGKRPCSNCAAKYMKKHKLTSIEGIDLAEFECVYSPAKRRGPVPGKVGQMRKEHQAAAAAAAAAAERAEAMAVAAAAATATTSATTNTNASVNAAAAAATTSVNQYYDPSSAAAAMAAAASLGLGTTSVGSSLPMNLASLYQQAEQQQQQQEQSNGGAAQQQPQWMKADTNGGTNTMSVEPSSRRLKTTSAHDSTISDRSNPDTVAAHLHLLDPNDTEGKRLRSYYNLSVDELFALPPIKGRDHVVTDVDAMVVTSSSPHFGGTGGGLNKLSIRASRFAEVAIGALVHNEISLAMELCNAIVHTLREVARVKRDQHQQQPPMDHDRFELARAYFLLGVFRAFRGDMERYFKYRRISLQHLSQVEDGYGAESLLAAVSFLDSWAYMIYNANAKALPNIDGEIAPLNKASFGCASAAPTTEQEQKYGVACGAAAVATNANNQMWIQGAPPVYLNNEAPLNARSLDALACAVRSCCDQANARFSNLSIQEGTDLDVPKDSIATPTATAVLHHENELCSRNMVLSAYTLLQQHESTLGGMQKNQGHHLIISAMDAFLENGEVKLAGSTSPGFTDSQIQSLLNVCNTAIENPLLLHHGGPTYHMVSNAAILLCHLLNGMYSMMTSNHNGGSNGSNHEMESAVFEEVLDTFFSIRKLLDIHRRKLPVKLRCHGIPRPASMSMSRNTSSSSSSNGGGNNAFIDLGDTILCGSRGCQGFVLMACSPCVAAERARAAEVQQREAQEREAAFGNSFGSSSRAAMGEAGLGPEEDELDRTLFEMENEFDMDDDALLNMLSTFVTAP